MIKKRIPAIIFALCSALFISQAVLAELCNLVFFIMGWATGSSYFDGRYGSKDVSVILCELLIILAVLGLFALVFLLSLASVKWKHLSLALIPFWLIAPLYYVVRGMLTGGHYIVYLGYYWDWYYRGNTETWYGWFNLLMLLMFFALGFLCIVSSVAAGITGIDIKKEKKDKKALKAAEPEPEAVPEVEPEEIVEPAPEEPAPEPEPEEKK